MAQIPTFDATQVNPESQFEPIANGDYPIMFVESEMKQTKAGTGAYLQLVAEVIEGPQKGRRLWERLNLQNQNQTAVEIAQRALSQICHAIGQMQVNDSAELHNKPLMATVTYVPADGQYGAKNEIKGYKAYGPQPTQQTAQPAAAPQPTPQQMAQQAAAAQHQPAATENPNPWAR